MRLRTLPVGGCAHGFTLVEMMVTLAILALLATMAAPAIDAFVARSTMRSLASDFSQSLQFARSQAINLNQCVAICMSTTVGGTNQCATTGSGVNNWAQGWIVFRLPGCGAVADSSPTRLSADTRDRILSVREGTQVRYQLTSSVRSIVFNPRGLPSAVATSFSLRDQQLADTDPINRKLVLSMSGRLTQQAYQP